MHIHFFHRIMYVKDVYVVNLQETRCYYNAVEITFSFLRFVESIPTDAVLSEFQLVWCFLK